MRVAAPVISPKRTDLLRRAAAGEEYFWNFEIGWPESDKGSILTPQALGATAGHSAGEVVERDVQRLRASAHGSRDYMNHIIYRMMQDYYFGNLMLGKLDLLSAQLGLESRCPFTEPKYSHFVYNIPAKFKQKDGMVKYFFKKAIDGILPDSIIYRPKQGFRTQVVELFKGTLGDWGRGAILDGGLTRTGFLRRDTLDQLLREHRAGGADNSNRLWTVLVLNLWHQRWIATWKQFVRNAWNAIHMPVIARLVTWPTILSGGCTDIRLSRDQFRRRYISGGGHDATQWLREWLRFY